MLHELSSKLRPVRRNSEETKQLKIRNAKAAGVKAGRSGKKAVPPKGSKLRAAYMAGYKHGKELKHVRIEKRHKRNRRRKFK